MEKRAPRERAPRTKRSGKPPRPARKLPDKLIVPQEAEVFRVHPDQAGMRLDQFLKQRLHWRSRTKVQKLIETREVTVRPPSPEPTQTDAKSASEPAGGVRVGRAYRVKLAEEVRLPLPPPADDAWRIAEIPLEILYEDDLLIVVNKPPDLVVHPAGKHRYDTLINALHLRYRDLKDGAKDILPKLAHRIDRETSGVLIAYKMRRHERRAPLVFERTGVKKEYLAITEGVFEQDSGVIDLPIGRQPGVDRNRATCIITAEGQPSRTGYEVLERFRASAAGPGPGGGGFTFVRCRLFTGRMHQIRVHAQAIGHPVLCDKIYGLRRELRLSDLGLPPAPAGDMMLLPVGKSFVSPAFSCPQRPGTEVIREDCVLLSRQALHAHRIAFTHPLTGAPMAVEAPLPADMRRVLEALRST